MGKGSDQPRRLLKQITLHAIDIVREPANPHALHSLKTVMAAADMDSARMAVEKAIKLHRVCMSGGDAPTADERSDLLAQLQAAHEALTGEPLPGDDTKSQQPTLREFEAHLREKYGWSNTMARRVSTSFKSAFSECSRDEDAAQREALQEIGASLKGFSLPSFGD
jgi:hypothetical protein